jgi:zinc transporter ZupT
VGGVAQTMQHAALASMIASAIVAATTAAFGSVLIVRGTVVEVSPLMLCGIAGLLVGVSLVVVLPQAIDSLGAQGWQTESCLCVFILAPMVMFFIEHIIVGDTRGGLSDGQMAHVHIQGGGPKSHQVYVINVSTLKERTTREQPVKFVHGTIEECQECRPMPPQTAPLLPLDERSSLLGSKGRILPRKPSAAESSAALKRCSSGFGVSFRLFAWIVDAALDGVLLATSRELTVLIPLTAAICLCSSGDVVCLYVYFTARKCSECFKAFAIAMVCCAFPVGCGLTLAVLKEFPVTLNTLRCVVSGLFIYVGFFELMPPIPHGQLNALKYFIAFSAGMLCAYISDTFEDSFAFVSALHRTAFHVRPHDVVPMFGGSVADMFGPFIASPPAPPHAADIISLMSNISNG